MTDLPDTIRIGPFDYRILRSKDPKTDKGTSAWGTFDSSRATINIRSSMPTNTHVQETFLHEVLHGVYYHSGLSIKDTDAEEQIVDRLATGLIMLIRANPWILEFLKDEG